MAEAEKPIDDTKRSSGFKNKTITKAANQKNNQKRNSFLDNFFFLFCQNNLAKK